MNAYVDTSVLLRVVLGERGRLRAWPRIRHAISSELIRVEALRTLDRARLARLLSDAEVAERRAAVDELLASFDLVVVDRRILRRATEPLPVSLGTLDAIHLASAVAVRARMPNLRVATHDDALATAARAVGFGLLA